MRNEILRWKVILPKLLWSFVALVFLASGVLSIAQEQLNEKYFGTFSGYTLPLKLKNNLSKSEIEARRAYLVAYYDASGRLHKVRKVLDGKTEFIHEYAYDAQSKLVEVIVTNHEGNISILKRTPDGRMVKDK